ncbi:MAG: hypothetical protein QM809_06600 [Gordonia sp. (in: high G+C Gram-positive bacteria)]|uniref:hypothetical protein n=1 Tax=Gordonia sp. (in: high G+C Gram-positive bacteria) TaxID=84139 RepID=UPI0039E3BA88
MLNDRGVQASITSGWIIAILSTVAYSPPMIAVWVGWAGITAWAVYEARRKHARAAESRRRCRPTS